MDNPRLLLAHKLVQAGIGGRTVAELNGTMTVGEFLRWQAYDDMFPFGYDDLNFGRLLHLLASIYSPKGSSPKLGNFILGRIPEQQATIEELEAKMDALAQRIQAHHED